MTGVAKLDGIKDFLQTLLDNKVKFLLFAHHRDILDAYEEFIEN